MKIASCPQCPESDGWPSRRRRSRWAKSRHPTRQKSNPPTLGSAVQLQGFVCHITLFAPKIMVVCHNSSAATAPVLVGWAFMKARHEKKHTLGGDYGRCSVFGARRSRGRCVRGWVGRVQSRRLCDRDATVAVLCRSG